MSPKRKRGLTSLALRAHILLLFLLPAAARAEVEEPPLIGQPENFSGAVGRFRIAATASITELQAEDPLIYSLHITCLGKFHSPPERPDLHRLPRFKNRFVILDLKQRDVSKDVPEGHAWEFSYSLKPRSPEVTEIPPLLFAYYKPGVIPNHKGYWTTATESIPLKVRPRSPAPLLDPRYRAPEFLYQQADSSAVLRYEDTLPLSSLQHFFEEQGFQVGWLEIMLILLLVVLIAPPALAVCWYLIWRRLYPDAARQARIRRSRAAQLALQALHAAKNKSEVMTRYLRERFDLTTATLTPLEVAEHLQRCGVSSELAGKVAEFFRACDAVRFAPHGSSETIAQKSGDVEKLILALESEPCSSFPS